ncbi:MAG: ATP-binding protein [Elusimicrobiota bacterium]
MKILGLWSLLKARAGLRARLLGFFAAALLLPVLITGWAVMRTARRSLVESILREQRELSRRVGDRVSVHVGHVRKTLLNAASQESFASATPAQQFPVLRQILANNPELMECAVLAPNGRETVKAARKGSAIVRANSLVHRGGRKEHAVPRRGRSYVGNIFFTERERIPQMFVSVPLNGRGSALLARLSLHGMWDLVSEVAVGKTGYAYVVDGQGALLAHPQRERVLAHENAAGRSVVKEFLSGQEETLGSGGRYHTHEGDDGEKTLAVHHRIEDLGWGVVVQTPLKEALAPVAAMGRRAAAAAAAFGVLFALAGLSLVRRILEPLNELQEGAQRIGRGDLALRLDIRTGDELQRLAEEFNAMADSLSALEQSKRDLTHMIVHDLKSPLTGLLGSMDYLSTGAAGPLTPDQKKMLSLGTKSGKDLLRMIQTLLDAAKMEEGKLELHRERFSLLELAAECVDDLEANIRREGKVVSVEVPKDLPKVWADRDLIYRTLGNLLSNALKHTSQGAEISIRAALADEGDAVVLSVRDSGEGIPPEFLDKIFDKFGQAEAKNRRHRVGVGLGLTFCKLAVEAHNGRIWVESRRGKGAEFFIRLPLAGDPEAPAAAASVPAAAG